MYNLMSHRLFRPFFLASTVSVWLLLASTSFAMNVNCTTVATMLYSAFHLNTDQQYRGVPDALLRQKFLQGVTYLTAYARATRPNATSLSDVCLTDAERRIVYWYSYLSEKSESHHRVVTNDYPLNFPEWWGNAPSSVTEYYFQENNVYAGPPLSFQSFSSLFRRLSADLSRFHQRIRHSFLPHERLTSTTSPTRRLMKGKPVTARLIREMFTVGGTFSALAELAFIHNSDIPSSVFYLPFKMLGTSIRPMCQGEKNIVCDAWNAALLELKRWPKYVNPSIVALLPRTVKVFHDPMRKTVKNQCAQYRSFGTVINSRHLVNKVAAISIRMRLLGIDQAVALSILNHTASYVFTCIRATKSEGVALRLTTGFLPMYHGMFAKLTAGMNLKGFPEIPTKIVQKHYGRKLAALSQFQSWGRLRYLNFNEPNKVKYENVKDYLFDRDTMNTVHAEALAYTSSNNQAKCVLGQNNPLTPVVNIMVQNYGWYEGGAVRVSIFQ